MIAPVLLLALSSVVSAIPVKRAQPTDWMQANIGLLGSRPLIHIAIPGSHDAGMSVIGAGTAFSDAANTQTQTLSINQQLVAGSRYFDIRPVISGGAYTTGHYSDVSVIDSWQGSDGQSIADVISDINSFTATNDELVIINLSHAYDTDGDNSDYPIFTQAQWEALFTQLLGLNHRYVDPNPTTVDLTRVPLSTFIGSSAAVLIIIQPDSPVDLGSFASQGFYQYSQLNAYNEYADTNTLSTMESDQLSKMASQRGSPDQSYFLLSWTLTQDALETIGLGDSILTLANSADPALYTALPPKLSANTYPNILYIDNFQNDGKIVDLAMTINTNFAAQ
ncbi:PLC-like phosphodiesterase [Roridomyces roridus]|uniref:PLC-like phosphodiesterase n=1 Tax=Roridomyces roridus TaxID=1738132 RepID=A0AAD7B1P5_9AGAR|nr:PLC-like phosphodiesterase [Roridomyces roridus]